MSTNRHPPKKNTPSGFSEEQLSGLIIKAFRVGINNGLKNCGVDVSTTSDLEHSFDNLVSDEVIKLAGQLNSAHDQETNKMLEHQGIILTLLSVMPNKKRDEQFSHLILELEEELKKYENKYSNNTSCYLLRGIVHQRFGENEEALEFYQRGLAIDPDNKRISAYLRTIVIEVKDEEIEEKKPTLGKNARKKLERRKKEAEPSVGMPSQAGMFAVSGADRNVRNKKENVIPQSPRPGNG